MEELQNTQILLRKFMDFVGDPKFKNHFSHKENLLNQRLSAINTDLAYIQIIANRINAYDTSKSSELTLDIKSLVIFCRIYTESVLNLVSLFVSDAGPNIPWNKIGTFAKRLTEKQPIEGTEIKYFWDIAGHIVQETSSKLNYRNFIAHEKEMGTEWPMAWPGHSNFDHVSVVNAYGRAKKKPDQSSGTPRDNIRTIYNFTDYIFEYIKNKHF